MSRPSTRPETRSGRPTAPSGPAPPKPRPRSTRRLDALEADRRQLDAALADALADAHSRYGALLAEHQDATRQAQAQAQDVQDRVDALGALAVERDRLACELLGVRAQLAAKEAEWSAERTHWVGATDSAAAEHRAAIQALEADRLQLEKSLRSTETPGAPAGHGHRLLPKGDETLGAGMVALELRAADARCQHLVQELADVRWTLHRANVRSKTLLKEMAVADARIAEMASRMDAALDADQRDMVSLRRDLMQFLCDSDSRFKTLTERRLTTRTDWNQWRQLADTGKRDGQDDAGDPNPKALRRLLPWAH
jgi:hypothetical protein